ncbi:MAG: lycopene cyclase family protein [Balneolaceae bacterium]|nr:lycopene cyclase family protein [Balneolaceae bacterium]
MANKKQFDIIIAGAGAAGLSLLWRILNSSVLRDQKILLIDQSFEPANDKTWCFWEDLSLPNEGVIHHSWEKLLVKIAGEDYSENLNEYVYKCIRSEDFTHHILQQAEKSEQVTFLEAGIKDFSSDGQFGFVQTTKGEFKSRKIFQSALKPPGFDNLEVDISLIQHFLGWEININKNLFDPNLAIFMDFEVPQSDGTSFIYLLPFSQNKALVEYTVFSENLLEKDRYREQVRNYLETRYNLYKDDFSIEREEFGAIPMEDRKYPAKYCNFVWNIGTIGGFAKPSTGYAFSRIQKRSLEIMNALEFQNPIPERRASSYRFRVYDIMMLYLLSHERDNALRAFECLFQKNSFDQVLKFLSEESNPALELSIFSKMPYMPFFRSMYKMKHRIFTGV